MGKWMGKRSLSHWILGAFFSDNPFRPIPMEIPELELVGFEC
jgi:hypothetical protein